MFFHSVTYFFVFLRIIWIHYWKYCISNIKINCNNFCNKLLYTGGKINVIYENSRKKAILGVLGLGYVGLPLAVEKANAGFKTVGYDIQKDKVDLVNSGINYIGDILDDELKNLVETKRLSATDDISFVSKCDAVAICVPTPLDEHQSPDISYVIDSAESIVPFIHKDMIIILESTTYPGTTEELLKPILEKSGLICGKDFYLAFSPERVDPGNKIYNTKNTPKVVGELHQIAARLQLCYMNRYWKPQFT